MGLLKAIKDAVAKVTNLKPEKPDEPKDVGKANDADVEITKLVDTSLEAKPEEDKSNDSPPEEPPVTKASLKDKLKSGMKSLGGKVKDARDDLRDRIDQIKDERTAEPEDESPFAKVESALDLIESKVNTWANTIDTLSRLSGAGTQQSKFQDIMYGMNRLSQLPELPIHKETQGMIFFTRPDLNLNYNNVAHVRQLSHLLAQNTDSVMNAIKLVLDPTTQRAGKPTILRNANKFRVGNDPNWHVIQSKLIDWRSPYINLLSNTCMSLSAPPDIGVSSYASPDGKFREQWVMPDDIAEVNGAYDLTAEFANVKGNAVQMLILTWVLYMGLLRSGHITPHPHNRLLNRMDFFTRIERFKFDESGTRIVQWYHCGAGFPQSINVGENFKLQREDPYDVSNKTVSVQFKCVGAVYNDPIQLWEFNLRMIKWNSDLADDRRLNKMYKVPREDIALTNNLSYPLINLATFEMEWWIYKEDYINAIKQIYPASRTKSMEAYSSNYKGGYGPTAGTGFGKP